MKAEVRQLLREAVESLTLGIELFNRPSECCRTSAVLILQHHSLEMLLKAGIVHRGGGIRDPGAEHTIGFDACVGRALSDGACRFLSDEQAALTRALSWVRGAAQHHVVTVAEPQLYLHAQSAVTLAREIMADVFQMDLARRLPRGVLPISTLAPVDVETWFENESNEIAKLLRPGGRRRAEAFARLTPLALLDAAIRGDSEQPSRGAIAARASELASGIPWPGVFTGIGGLELTPDGAGISIGLRITKAEGLPIRLVPEGTPGALTVGVRRVDELGYYNLNLSQLATHVGLSSNKTVAVVWYLSVREDADCYKEFRIGQSLHKRYSHRAIERLRKCVAETPVEEIWAAYKESLAGRLGGRPIVVSSAGVD